MADPKRVPDELLVAGVAAALERVVGEIAFGEGAPYSVADIWNVAASYARCREFSSPEECYHAIVGAATRYTS